MNIKELLELAGELGKVVVVDDSGNVKGVFVTYESFQRLMGSNLAQSDSPESDVAEKVNRAIIEAQMQDDDDLPAAEAAVAVPVESVGGAPQRLNSLLSKRAEELFKSIPQNKAAVREKVDMRAEVIDPNFDWNAPEGGNDDEEIRPNFDNI